MRDEQNWYAQDFETPKPGAGRGWLIAITLIVTTVCIVAGVLWFVVAGLQRGGLRDMLFGRSGGEETQEELTSRLEPVRDQFESALADNGLPAGANAEVEAAINELTAALVSGDDSRFAALIDQTAFESRVRGSGELSGTASLNFGIEFRGWQAYYIPVYADRILIASVSEAPDSDIVKVATFAYVGSYPERFVWYYTRQGNGLKLVDWMPVDDAQLASVTASRNYTSAYHHAWTTFVDLLEEDFSSIDDDGFRELSRKYVPPLVRAEALTILARTAIAQGRYEVTLELLDLLSSIRPTPIEQWHRARCFYAGGDYAAALSALDKYVAFVGPGIDELLFRAEVCEAMGRNDDAIDFYLRVLSFDPHVDRLYAVSGYLRSEDAERLGACLMAVPEHERATAASLWASTLLNLDRDDLTDPIIVIARSGPQDAPEFLALEARLAEKQGDRTEMIEKYKAAFSTAGPEHEEYHSWLYSWADALQSDGRGDEAVRDSPDPAQTFYDLAIDDGFVMVSRATLKTLAKGLAEAEPDSTSARTTAALWKQIAEGLVAIEERDYPTAQTVLESVLNAVPDDDNSVDAPAMINVASWSVAEWLTEAAARTGQVESAMSALHDDEGSFASLAHRCCDAELADSLRNVLKYGRARQLGQADRGYFDARLLDLDGDKDGARRAMQSFLKRAVSEGNEQPYPASNWLAVDAAENNSWRSLIQQLPYSSVLDSLSTQLTVRNRHADVLALVSLAQAAGLAAKDTDSVLVNALHETGDWPRLVEFAATWQPSEARTLGLYELYDPVPEKLFDAFLAEQEFDQATAFIEEHGDESAIWTLKLRVAQGNQKAVTEMLNRADTDSAALLSSLYSNPVTRAILGSPEWDEFRANHPSPLSSLDDMGYFNRSLLLACSGDSTLTFPTMNTAVSALFPNAKIEQLPPPEASTPESGTARGQNLSCRVIDGDRSFVITAGTGTWDDRDADQEAAGESALSPDLEQLWTDHASWIHLEVEDGGPSARRCQLTRALGKMAASLAIAHGIEKVSIVSAAGEFAGMNGEVLSQLQAGQIQDLHEAETSYPASFVEMTDDDWKTKSRRLRELKQHLRNTPPETGKLYITISKRIGKDDHRMDLPVIRIETPLQPTTIIARQPDHPAIPPRMRDTTVSVPIYNVVDWEQR